MRALAISTSDRLLSAVAPIGLACAAGTALVVDLDPSGPAYPGSGSLAELVEAGPRLADLRPRRHGVAVLRNGGIGREQAAPVLEALLDGWPAIVLRLGMSAATVGVVPVIGVHALLPGVLSPPAGERVVYQRTSWGSSAPGPGTVLPRPSRRVIGRLLRGMSPGPSRWILAWRGVWRWA